MPTLYHAPESRSSRVIAQLMLMGKLDEVDVVVVEVRRQDGTGGHDPKNPHPEGKVPYLITDDGDAIRESNAIMSYLDELFGYPLGVAPGQVGRGKFVSLMSVYNSICEPVIVTTMLGIEHEGIAKSFGTMSNVGGDLSKAIGEQDFLLGDKLTIADLIMASPFQWMESLTPDIPNVKAWLARVNAASPVQELMAFEEDAKRLIAAAA